MREADWTYEAPPGGSDTMWLESYAVYDSDGEPLGKVLTVLEHEGRVYLAVEGSPVPLKHDRWAVPFDLVGQIDDQDLGVVLRISAEAPSNRRCVVPGSYPTDRRSPRGRREC